MRGGVLTDLEESWSVLKDRVGPQEFCNGDLPRFFYWLAILGQS